MRSQIGLVGSAEYGDLRIDFLHNVTCFCSDLHPDPEEVKQLDEDVNYHQDQPCGSFECSKCHKWFPSYFKLVKHRRSCWFVLPMLRCGRCHKEFHSHPDLMRHRDRSGHCRNWGLEKVNRVNEGVIGENKVWSARAPIPRDYEVVFTNLDSSSRKAYVVRKSRYSPYGEDHEEPYVLGKDIYEPEA